MNAFSLGSTGKLAAVEIISTVATIEHACVERGERVDVGFFVERLVEKANNSRTVCCPKLILYWNF